MLQLPLPHTFLEYPFLTQMVCMTLESHEVFLKKKFIMQDNWVELHFNYLLREQLKPKTGNQHSKKCFACPNLIPNILFAY